ncbi:hypothetical protein PR202_ga27528 [Eleusine coracana subsp. coracana]|uniref:Uncharacterized protein n=1 Tax=Eleusine coracana subsp. coracana TaxID=191504 RepID=A0AAV5DGQ6_ELECO|nr:hypothetical protein PR202_ga27528 [Eleusine coracana subsp. coracana]
MRGDRGAGVTSRRPEEERNTAALSCRRRGQRGAGEASALEEVDKASVGRRPAASLRPRLAVVRSKRAARHGTASLGGTVGTASVSLGGTASRGSRGRRPAGEKVSGRGESEELRPAAPAAGRTPACSSSGTGAGRRQGASSAARVSGDVGGELRRRRRRAGRGNERAAAGVGLTGLRPAGLVNCRP